MRKNEMTKKQLETYELVREKLGDYGFELDNNSWFHKNLSAEEEIEANFDNGDMELVLEYSVKQNVFHLWLTDNDTGKEVTFDLHVGKKLEEVLKCIHLFKERVNGNNFRRYVNELVKLCPKVFTWKDDVQHRMVADEE